MNKPKLKFKMVQVIWEDAAGLHGWHTVEKHKASGTLMCHTVGHLLKRDKHSVVVGLTLEQEDQEAIADSCTIPAGWVRSIKTLRVGR